MMQGHIDLNPQVLRFQKQQKIELVDFIYLKMATNKPLQTFLLYTEILSSRKTV